MQEKNIKYLKETLFSLKSELFPQSWENLINEYHDININYLIDNKKEMAEKPNITIILSPNVSKSELLLMVQSIYGQDLPAFEILIPTNLGNKLNSEILKHENIHILDAESKDFKNFALKHSKGKYILFLDDFTILSPNSLRVLFTQSKNSNFDMVSASISRLSHDNISNYPSQELVYSYRNTLKPYKKSKFNYLDIHLNNKLIKKEFLTQSKFKFSNETSSDVEKLYKTAKFKKTHGKYFFSDKKENEMFIYLKNRKKSIFLKTYFLLFLSHILYIGLKLKRSVQNQLKMNS